MADRSLVLRRCFPIGAERCCPVAGRFCVAGYGREPTGFLGQMRHCCRLSGKTARFEGIEDLSEKLEAPHGWDRSEDGITDELMTKLHDVTVASEGAGVERFEQRGFVVVGMCA